MKQVLIWGDNPHGITGFGKVVKNIIRQIHDPMRYKIDVLGISYLGDPYPIDEYNGNKIFYDVYSPFEAGKQLDLYATGKLKSFLSSGKVDILFIVQDTFIVNRVINDILAIRNSLKKKFVTIFYYPIDNKFVWQNWITDSVSKVDIPVCYTEFGKKVSLKHDRKLKDMHVIYHGTDKNMFKPLPKESIATMRRSFWGEEVAGRFIVLNVNRNQPRKDLNRTFSVFAFLKKRKPNSYLYVLANPADIGGNVIDVAKQYGLEYGKDWQCPDPAKYNPMVGIPEQQVSLLYNLSDVCISTTLGEGWGLSLTEAMACGCPVIFPNNTSMTEIIGESEDDELGIRGTLVSSGDNGNTVCLGQGDNNLIRPLVNVEEMVEFLVQYHECHKLENNEFKLKAMEAVDWVPSWDDVGRLWREVFLEASNLQDDINGE